MIFFIDTTSSKSADLNVLPTFKNKDGLLNKHWAPKLQNTFKNLKSSSMFTGEKGETFYFSTADNTSYLTYGLGEISKITSETLRRTFASLYNQLKNSSKEISIDINELFDASQSDKDLTAIIEGMLLASYEYTKYKEKADKAKLQKIHLIVAKEDKKRISHLTSEIQTVCDAIFLARDFVNDPPNFLNSETYAKLLAQDAKKLKGVKIKIYEKKELQKMNMGMFLSVNAGSNYAPKLVHLEYIPKKKSKSSKHIALVGKGLTFDTGGYSLKPGTSMVNMKTDMGGSATVYAAFKAAVQLESHNKISCFLGITDNAVSPTATMPDSIVKAMNGKTVEIANTDAEGRLVLGDVLTLASKQKPDYIIDAATLTGAVLVALGSEVCGLMGNNQELKDKIKQSAQEADEYVWELPIIQEYRDDIKSPVAELRNIGTNGNGGSCKAAAFLEHFVEEGIAWAHLDVAGVVWAQSHLPYCQSKGASGLIVRTLTNFLRK